jgi:hypothetical protein
MIVGLKSLSTGVPLFELVQKDWELFVSDSSCIKVMDSIIALDVDDIKKARITDSRSTVAYQENITDCVNVWDSLKEDIKNHHRFTTSLDKLKDAGWDTLLDNKMLLNPGTVYYRARIHYKKDDLFGTKQMGAPKSGDNPTQFICEYVSLTQDVSGIRFSSSVYKQGTNLVIFKPDLMNCIGVENYLVKDLDITEELDK